MKRPCEQDELAVEVMLHFSVALKALVVQTLVKNEGLPYAALASSLIVPLLEQAARIAAAGYAALQRPFNMEAFLKLAAETAAKEAQVIRHITGDFTEAGHA